MYNCVYIHIRIYTHNAILLSHKNNEILPSATTWMDFFEYLLSEISQKKTNTMLLHLYVESRNQNKRINKTKLRREQNGGYQRGIRKWVKWAKGVKMLKLPVK